MSPEEVHTAGGSCVASGDALTKARNQWKPIQRSGTNCFERPCELVLSETGMQSAVRPSGLVVAPATQGSCNAVGTDWSPWAVSTSPELHCQFGHGRADLHPTNGTECNRAHGRTGRLPESAGHPGCRPRSCSAGRVTNSDACSRSVSTTTGTDWPSTVRSRTLDNPTWT